MSRPRTYRTEAVVLRQTTLGEADRILTLYTPDAGKVRAVAKGVRRQKSRLRGHLELLTRVSVSISTGRSLDIVAEAQTIEAFRKVTEDLERLTRGLYIAELTDGFTVEHSSNEPVYRLLVETLERLSTTDRPTLLTRRFEALLLGYSGFGPELYGCGAGAGRPRVQLLDGRGRVPPMPSGLRGARSAVRQHYEGHAAPSAPARLRQYRIGARF